MFKSKERSSFGRSNSGRDFKKGNFNKKSDFKSGFKKDFSSDSRSREGFKNSSEAPKSDFKRSDSSRSRGSFPKDSPRIHRKKTMGFSGSKFSGGNLRNQGFAKKGRGRKNLGEFIDINTYIYTPEEKDLKVNSYESKNTFKDFKFNEKINSQILLKEFTHPTAIQDILIPEVLKGSDVLGLANTGSGKTASFLLPLLERISQGTTKKVLVLAPVRELAEQINREFLYFADNLRYFSTLCVGGMDIFKQIKSLRKSNQFVIATPGRLFDLHKRNAINFAEFDTIVLDEVDRMMDMGFIGEVRDVMKLLPEKKHCLFFSATLPDKIKKIAHEFSDTIKTFDTRVGQSSRKVHQDVVKYDSYKEKFTKFIDILESDKAEKTIVFIETKAEVDRVFKELRDAGYKNIGVLHGDKRQNERRRTMAKFRDSEISVLLSTDVASRGLDVPDISCVINYTIPQTKEDYTHRVGRAGRGSTHGYAFTFVK